MPIIDATKQVYSVMLLFGNPVLFTVHKVNPKTIPSSLYAYEIQLNEYGEPIYMADNINSDYFGGTALSVEPIELHEHNCRSMDENDLIHHTGHNFSRLDEFLETFGQAEQLPVLSP